MNFSLFNDDTLEWAKLSLGKYNGWEVKYEEKETTTIKLKKGTSTNLTPKKETEEPKDDFDNLISKMFKHRQ